MSMCESPVPAAQPAVDIKPEKGKEKSLHLCNHCNTRIPSISKDPHDDCLLVEARYVQWNLVV